MFIGKVADNLSLERIEWMLGEKCSNILLHLSQVDLYV